MLKGSAAESVSDAASGRLRRPVAYDQALKTDCFAWKASVLECSYKSHFHLRRLNVYLCSGFSENWGISSVSWDLDPNGWEAPVTVEAKLLQGCVVAGSKTSEFVASGGPIGCLPAITEPRRSSGRAEKAKYSTKTSMKKAQRPCLWSKHYRQQRGCRGAERGNRSELSSFRDFSKV